MILTVIHMNCVLFPITPEEHKGWPPELLSAYLRENGTGLTNSNPTGDDRKCDFHACITTSQIIRCITDQGQEKSTFTH